MDIRKTYEMRFSAEQIYSAWISNDSVVAPVTSIEVDRKVGGIFRLRTGSGDSAGVMEGKLLRIEPNNHLQYTWHWGGPGTPSIVDVQFADQGEQTRVDVSHTGLDSPESAEAHEKGWDAYIRGLSKILEG